MNRFLTAAAAVLVSAAAFAAETLPNRTAIDAVMRRAADWQIMHTTGHYASLDKWEHGPVIIGMNEWGALSEQEYGDKSYTYWLMGVGDGLRWRPYLRPGNPSHADDLCTPQGWLNLFTRVGDRRRIAPTKKRMDDIIANPPRNSLDLSKNRSALKRWSWCDSLYMAPAAYAHMSLLTGDPKYMAFMDAEFKAATEYLYDKKEHLYFRDSRYFPTAKYAPSTPNREANGSKVFWGRGNGWVFAGLANLLRTLPKDAANRPYYERIYREMAERLNGLQCRDGCWHASLLDPDSFPSPETSATGFIVYGLAWGINSGLLDRDTYLPAVTKGWNTLAASVRKDGMLGYVQPVGADPRKVTKDMTAPYGVGALLQAGMQVRLLAAPDKH